MLGSLQTKLSSNIHLTEQKMQWSLFLLILMVQCSFFVCHHHEYHFIEKNMSWIAAQNYCRQMHTDLVTVYDMTDIDRLRGLVNTGEAWIGLDSKPGKSNRQWHWSLPGVEFNETDWHPREPNDWGGPENCAFMVNNKWKDDSCRKNRAFICYNESGKRFSYIQNRKTWPEAQKHCRKHHTDLVSGLSQLREQNFGSYAHFWIGLFRDTWRWSDSSNSSFRNWDLKSFKDKGDKKCAVLHKSGNWSSDECQSQKPFLCYDDEVILIKQNKTWAEALNYCREHYRDLVSITNPRQQSLVQARAENADTAFVWVGLLYSCPLDLWFWVSDELLCYENFAPNSKNESCYTSVAMRQGGKWFSKNEREMFNFVCALQ